MQVIVSNDQDLSSVFPVTCTVFGVKEIATLKFIPRWSFDEWWDSFNMYSRYFEYI